MDLASHQRKILGLIKASYDGSTDEDPYIRALADSRGLELIREISTWWRTIGIEKSCALTPRLLKQLGVFDQAVGEFVTGRAVSPFVEHAALAFLDAISRHPDALIAAVARFELALIRVKQGNRDEHWIDWPRDPGPVLASLLHEAPLPEQGSGPPYRTLVSHAVPDLFRIVGPTPE